MNTSGRRDKVFVPGVGIRLLSAILAGLGAVTVAALALSLLRLPISRPVAAAIVAAGLTAALGYFRFLRPRAPRRGAGGGPKFPKPLKWFILLAALFYLLLGAMAWAFPDLGYDGLWYHTPTMHFWSARGHVHWVEFDLPSWADRGDFNINGFPKGVELLWFTALRAGLPPRLLNALNLPALALGVLAIFCLARLWGAPKDFSLAAAALFIFVPVNISLSFTTLVDPATAAFYAALMAMTAAATRMILGGTVPWRYAPGLGAALGLATGAKGTGIILPPLLCVLLGAAFAAAALGKRKAPAGAGNADRRAGVGPKPFLSRGLRFLLLTALAAAAVGGFWSLRNLARTGSPAYPVGLRIGEKTIFPGARIGAYLPKPLLRGTEEWPQSRRVLHSWLDNLGGWRTAMTSNDHPSGGFGPLWLFACLPALLVLLVQAVKGFFSRRGEAARSPELDSLPFVAAIALALFFFMPPGHNHKARYTIWLYGPGLAALAAVAGQLRTAGPRTVRRAAAVWAAAAAALFLHRGFYGFNHHLGRLGDSGGMAGAPLAARAASAFAEPYPAGYFWPDLAGGIFEHVFNDPRPVALGPMRLSAQPVLGHLVQDRNFGKRAVYFLDPARAEDPGRIEKFIRENNIRYVIWDRGMPVPPPLGRTAAIDETAGRYFRVLIIAPKEIE